MTSAIATTVINALIIVLLVVTIAYCWLLNRRIKILQDSRGELAKLLKHFDESTQRASDSIIALQSASKKIGDNIQQHMDKANYLIDDLTFMIEKGGKLANQMEASFAVGRAQAKVSAAQMRSTQQQAPVRETRAAAQPQALSFTDDEVMEEPQPQAAQAFEKPEFPRYELPKAQTAATKTKDKTNTALGEALERVVARRDAPSAAIEPQQGTRPKSRAEQDLLDLIKAGIKG